MFHFVYVTLLATIGKVLEICGSHIKPSNYPAS